MKKKALTPFIIIFLLFASIGTAPAGTILIGCKTWYETTWDSAILKIFAKMMTDQMEENTEVTYTEIDYETFVGSGYLAGPVLGYQTDDGKWSFSFAPMIMSSFKQDVYGTALVPQAFGETLTIPFEVNDRTAVDVSRTDFDFAASYALDDYDYWFSLLQYCKLFAGIKYQKIEYDFEFHTRILSVVDTGEISMDYKVIIPSIGGGFFYPFTDNIVAGAQGGFGYAFFDGINADDALVLNVEATVTISPVDRLYLQFGYRYQAFSYHVHSSGSDHTYQAMDKTRGPVFAAILTF